MAQFEQMFGSPTRTSPASTQTNKSSSAEDSMNTFFNNLFNDGDNQQLIESVSIRDVSVTLPTLQIDFSKPADEIVAAVQSEEEYLLGLEGSAFAIDVSDESQHKLHQNEVNKATFGEVLDRLKMVRFSYETNNFEHTNSRQ